MARAARSVLGIGLIAIALAVACNNTLTGTLTPVPPVHRVPVELEGTTILIAEDPIIETRDPMHIERAREKNVPHDYRVAMERALELAGFRVTHNASDKHDLVAKLALAVSEENDEVRQVYRCGFVKDGGEAVAQIDWSWPKNIYVDVYDVYDFATHNLATEVATNRRLMGYLRSFQRDRDAGADGGS